MNSIECALIGRLGRDPELRHSQAGKPWLPISIGVGSDDNTQWVGVTVFGPKAEELAGQVTKGARLYIEGRDLRLDRWTGNDGKERTGLKCVATRVEVLGQIGHSRPPPKSKAPEFEQAAAPTAAPPAQRDWQRPVDDQIPF